MHHLLAGSSKTKYKANRGPANHLGIAYDVAVLQVLQVLHLRVNAPRQGDLILPAGSSGGNRQGVVRATASHLWAKAEMKYKPKHNRSLTLECSVRGTVKTSMKKNDGDTYHTKRTLENKHDV
jgi:hypothetical protein